MHRVKRNAMRVRHGGRGGSETLAVIAPDTSTWNLLSMVAGNRDQL